MNHKENNAYYSSIVEEGDYIKFSLTHKTLFQIHVKLDELNPGIICKK